MLVFTNIYITYIIVEFEGSLPHSQELAADP